MEKDNGLSFRHVESELPVGHSGGIYCCPISQFQSTPVAITITSGLSTLTWPRQTASNKPLCLLVSTFHSQLSCAAGLIFPEQDHNHIPCYHTYTLPGTHYHIIISHTAIDHVPHNICFHTIISHTIII